MASRAGAELYQDFFGQYPFKTGNKHSVVNFTIKPVPDTNSRYKTHIFNAIDVVASYFFLMGYFLSDDCLKVRSINFFMN